MTFDEDEPYTHKSQYMLHATLMGDHDSSLTGNAEDNCLGPNSGSNVLDGRGGTDTAVFRGECATYEISALANNRFRVVDTSDGRDGVTELVDIEVLSFKDGVYEDG